VVENAKKFVGESWPYLPLTRQFVAEYQRYGTDPKPEHTEPEPDEGPADDFAAWLAANPCPDLQKLIERAGGYDKITAEQWAEYDCAMADWQRRRRERLQSH